MKKFVFTLVATVAIVAISTQVQAQKIGVFSSEQVIQALPEHADIERKLESFRKDSLSKELDELEAKYKAAEETYKKDSIAKKTNAILELDLKNKNELAQRLINWGRYEQQVIQYKYMEYAQPLAEKVQKALQKVQKEKGVTIVLRTEVLDQLGDQSGVVNLILPVAKELKLKVGDDTPTATDKKK